MTQSRGLVKRVVPRLRDRNLINRRRSKIVLMQTRQDDPAGVMAHGGRYAGGKALIILGGNSARRWREVQEEIQADVILGGNGVNMVVSNLDYWVCAENMTVSNKMALRGDPRAIEFMRMFNYPSGAKTKLVNYISWDLLNDKSNAIKIDRKGWDRGKIPASFSFRNYGDGLLNGWRFDHPSAITVPTSVGTVGVQLIHMAGILGVSEIHTIGFDLVQQGDKSHHWYSYPIYQPDKFRRPGMFVDYLGLHTQLIWIETAEFLKTLLPYFKREGIQWIDHSQGLLSDEIFSGI